MTKYNTALDSMIRNYRDLAKTQGINTDDLTNPELWVIIDDCSGFATPEEDEEYFLQVLRERRV